MDFWNRARSNLTWNQPAQTDPNTTQNQTQIGLLPQRELKARSHAEVEVDLCLERRNRSHMVWRSFLATILFTIWLSWSKKEFFVLLWHKVTKWVGASFVSETVIGEKSLDLLVGSDCGWWQRSRPDAEIAAPPLPEKTPQAIVRKSLFAAGLRTSVEQVRRRRRPCTGLISVQFCDLKPLPPIAIFVGTWPEEYRRRCRKSPVAGEEKVADLNWIGAEWEKKEPRFLGQFWVGSRFKI